ncbi:MAG: response regulator transcription factor [Pseudanabaenaceae cyanobacterium SKYGB_i_bin29]|nr:response regulator transcription factor [Pseudanabaenaceae cyanobacterium SKYG29]MDW8421436.1 response regulator transcription factor [Pseudanabaenaceae cyanobacterium SKYGB_i_bin29]
MEEQKPQILIVEDQRIFVRDLTEILVEGGYEVCGSFASGQQAIEKIPELSPDLVLLDIRLVGEVDGVEVGEYLKLFYNIPFIYVTGNTDEETVARAAKTKPEGFITKPFRPEQLLATIAVALQKYRTTEPKDIYSYGRFAKLVQYLENHIDRDIKLGEMAQLMQMNSSYFCRVFHQEIGVSPHQFLLQMRIKKAKQLLRQSPQMSVNDIAISCGFSSQSLLNKHFKKLVGTTPTQYRHNRDII